MQRILLHHCTVPAELDPGLLERWIALLPAAKAARVARMSDPVARAASVLGIALLCDCAMRAGLDPPRPGGLQFPEVGKPGWPSGRDFSISHAAGRVACAMAPAGVQVGLDIESAGAAGRSGLRLVAGEAELETVSAAGLTVTDLWTAKEAVAKLTGEGLAGVARVRVAAATATLDGRGYALARPILAPGLHCAVAMSVELPIESREVLAPRLPG